MHPMPMQVTKTGTGANGCDQGVFAMSAAYDKWVGRFMISAICDDWRNPKILLAVSASDSVTGYWNLYSVPAENQPTTWKCANGRRGYPDYSQVCNYVQTCMYMRACVRVCVCVCVCVCARAVCK